MTLEPYGEAAACKAAEVGSTPTGVSVRIFARPGNPRRASPRALGAPPDCRFGRHPEIPRGNRSNGLARPPPNGNHLPFLADTRGVHHHSNRSTSPRNLRLKRELAQAARLTGRITSLKMVSERTCGFDSRRRREALLRNWQTRHPYLAKP